MATGRTVLKNSRFYMDGYDFSGYSRQFGPLSWTFATDEQAALTDNVKNSLLGHATITPTVLNAFLDNTATSGLHVIANAANAARTVMIPIGIRAEPAAGDPVFCGIYEQTDYMMEGGETVFATINFGNWDAANRISYQKPWGRLLHAKGAETGANSATGGVDNGAASTAGGYFVYQVFSGNGTATLSVDDSADDSSYSALSGATSGSIDCSSVKYGIVALGTTATVKRYLRWQLALGTATTVTFATAFVRG